MSAKLIKGYKVIPLRFSESSSAQHDLFIKEHSVKQESADKPSERTLFVLNVPPYATEEALRRVFLCAGKVARVIFQDKPNSSNAPSTGKIAGFKVAYVVYEKIASVEKALRLDSLPPLSTAQNPILTGLAKYVKQYNESICDQGKLEKEVREFMARFDKQEEKRKRQEKQKDGGEWTVVTKKSRRPGLSRKESLGNKLLEKSNKGAKRKQLDDFYTFQIRESKRQYLLEMRKKYEQDKKKVEAMKQARKFKPL